MLTARQGRSLILALVVHFALLLPVAELAHGAGHADEQSCETCTQLGALKSGAIPAAASPGAPVLGPGAPRPVAGAAPASTPARASARAPPAS
jgi:hypothetical protein